MAEVDVSYDGNQSSRSWVIQQNSYKGNQRYYKVGCDGTVAIFKSARVENGRILWIEMSNELICHKLGKFVGAPVADVSLGDLPGKGTGLFSYWAGDKEFNPQADTLGRVVSNIDKLKDLYVFDQWTFNYNRQARHVLLDKAINGSYTLTAIDHGHTLNDYKGNKMEAHPEFRLEPSQTYFNVGFNSLSELEEAIQRILTVPDSTVENAIDHSIVEISRYASPDDLKDVETNCKVVRQILVERRDNIRQIMTDWCRLNGKTIS